METFKRLCSVGMALPLDDVGAWQDKGQPKALGKGKGARKALGKGKGKKGLWMEKSKKKSHTKQRKKLSRKP